MKYYLYISDSKIDVLFPDISSTERKNIESEISANLGIVKFKRNEKRNANDDAIVRLNSVIKHLNKKNLVGTIKKPKSWVRGNCEVCIKEDETNGGAVFFLGIFGKICFALGGSSHHVVGHNIKKDTTKGMSFAPRLINSLVNMLDNPVIYKDDNSNVEKILARRVSQGKIAWAQQISEMLQDNDETYYSVEFIAKKLVTADYAGCKYLLATPLYVSLIDS